MINFIKELLPWVSPLLTGAVGWFFSKKHYFKRDLKAKDTANEASSSDVIRKNLELYQEMIDDIAEKYKRRIEYAEKEIESLTKLVDHLKQNIKNMKEDHKREEEALKRKIAELEKKHK